MQLDCTYDGSFDGFIDGCIMMDLMTAYCMAEWWLGYIVKIGLCTMCDGCIDGIYNGWLNRVI